MYINVYNLHICIYHTYVLVHITCLHLVFLLYCRLEVSTSTNSARCLSPKLPTFFTGIEASFLGALTCYVD